MTQWEEAFNPFFVRNVVVALVAVYVLRFVSRLEIVQTPCKLLGYVVILFWASLAFVSVAYTLYHTGVLAVVFNALAAQFTLLDLLRESAVWKEIIIGLRL